MLPDEVPATMHDQSPAFPDGHKRADTKEPPQMTKSVAADRDLTEQRRSPELPDSFVHPTKVPRTPQAPQPVFQGNSESEMRPFAAGASSVQSVRTPPPDLRQGQLAFSAVQFLPVPLLILSSLKRLVLANEAMGRLLGLPCEPAGERDMAALDNIRGLSLSQLGVEVIQDGQLTPFDWDRYLDSLIPSSNAGRSAPHGRDLSQLVPHDSNVPNGGGVDTDYPERISHQPGQTGVVEVLITRNDFAKSSSTSVNRGKAVAPQHRAKVVINPFLVDHQQTYFNLTFTDIKIQSSLSSDATARDSEAVANAGGLTAAAPTQPESDVHTGSESERKKDEEQERFRIMCDTMPQLVWTTTPDGDADFFNQRWYEYTGLTPEEVMGHGWTTAVHPDDVAKSERLFQRSVRTGEPYETEYRCRSKTGDWNWFIVRALPFRSKTGNIKKWLGTCTDAHVSIERGREVERTWQQLLAVISHAQVTVFQVDTQRRVTLLEGAMIEEAIGGHDFGPRWYGGRDMYEVFGKVSKSPHERQQRFLGPIETILAGHPAEILQDDELGKLSSPGHHDTRSRPSTTDFQVDGRFYRTRFLPIGVRDADGLVRGANVEGVIGVVRDITELKSKEADILRQAREKQQLMASEAAAKEASKLKSQFLANMSHEIRTPITGVIGMAELLLDLDLGEEQREFTENIYRSANALLTVINDILDFSKVESGRLDIEEVQFSLSVIVGDVNKMLGFAAQRKNLDFSSDVSDDIVNDLVVLGDPGRVRQIVTNLLTNSIKFTNQGHVKFSVLKETETANTVEIKFVIEDTGIGIEEEVRERLFVPFSQGDASTARKFGGTGLGLTICKSLLDLMHGRITLESTVGSGTTATFWIPFKKSASTNTDLVGIEPLADGLPSRLQSELSVSGHGSEPDGLLGSVPPELASSGLSDGLKQSRAPNRKVSSNVTPSVTPSMQEISDAKREHTHILVVEDNAINQQIAIKTIEKLGFGVSAVWNGKEALDYLVAAQEGKQTKPDVILMDVQMPVIDGYKCTHLLRYHLPYKTYVQDVPIVAMTASAIQGDREKCRKAGMDDYLAKPVRGVILEKMLVRWTARRRPDPSKNDSSPGSEVSEVECSNHGEHCDNADIPCVEHDDDDFVDLEQTPQDELDRHPIDAMLTPIQEGSHGQSQEQSGEWLAIKTSQEKPRLSRSDTDETQVARMKVERKDSLQTAKRTTSKTSNETDGELAAHGRDAKLFDAAGARSKQIPPPHVPSPEPRPGSGHGEALTEANMEKHMREEDYKHWHRHDINETSEGDS
jgi:PAS domain S-box-containing protein